MSGINNDTVNIGGIMFNKSDVLSSSSTQKKGELYNGQPVFSYKVETKHGTYTFNEQHPINNDKQASIFVDGKHVKIANCDLSALKGTENSDKYLLSDTSLRFVDIAGDGNRDKIILTGQSDLVKVNKDDSDKVDDWRSFSLEDAVSYQESESINAMDNVQNSKLTRLDGGVTTENNEFSIFKDSQGNSVYRVDYQNNNPDNVFDQEEVRSPDGKLISYTERSYTKDGTMWYTKHIFDENGQEVKTLKTECDASGKPIETKEIPQKSGTFMVGTAHMGVPLDGQHGDPGLIAKLTEWGAKIIGRD